MKKLSSILLEQRAARKEAKETERGELLKEFLRNIKPSWDAKRFGELTIARLAKKIEGVPTKDLYYLKRVCEDSKNYAKRFFWELNPKKHTGV